MFIIGKYGSQDKEEEEGDVGRLSEDGKLIVMIVEQKMVSSLTEEVKKRDKKIEMLEQEVVNLKHGMIKLDEKLNDASRRRMNGAMCRWYRVVQCQW